MPESTFKLNPIIAGLEAESKGKKIPVALLMFTVGLGISLYNLIESDQGYTWELDSVVIPAYQDFTSSTFISGFLKASLPQIPLTTLNSVVSVCKLSDDLFPEKNVTRESVAYSVGAMNIIGCLFGAMPMCHGAGGLAGQYRFGARSGSSVVFLGTMKILLVVLLGGGLVSLLEVYPNSILGVMLIFAGLELASAGSEMNNKKEVAVTLGTAAGCLALKSTGLGCVVGLFISTVQMFLEPHNKEKEDDDDQEPETRYESGRLPLGGYSGPDLRSTERASTAQHGVTLHLNGDLSEERAVQDDTSKDPESDVYAESGIDSESDARSDASVRV